jgi:hypothetical protein
VEVTAAAVPEELMTVVQLEERQGLLLAGEWLVLALE